MTGDISVVGIGGSLSAQSSSRAAGWAVPLVIPIPRAWRVFDREGVHDENVSDQLRALGREVTRAAKQFGAKVLTTPDAERAEAQIQPITREEAKSEGGQVSSPEVGMLRET